jgi:hypothetical protein
MLDSAYGGQVRRQAVNAFGQPPGAASISSICFTMPFDDGDFGGRQAVKGVNHSVGLLEYIFISLNQSKKSIYVLDLAARDDINALRALITSDAERGDRPR